MAGTPTSKIIETIVEFEKMQGGFAALTASVQALAARVQALEQTLAQMAGAQGGRS